MNLSHKGFTVEIEEADETSLHDWCVVGVDEHVYRCGSGYETEDDAWSEATKWIDSYIKSLPANETTRVALYIQAKLKEIEESLQVITQGRYSKHYQRLAPAGGDVKALLLTSTENITEAMKANERAIRAIKKFPEEDLQTAIERYLSLND